MYFQKFTDMNSRLQQFLDLEKLSAARFAEIMGLQRSGISHLLSGRNKPGYDFITRFLKHFPQINAEWFLLGIGKPYKSMTVEDADTGTSEIPSLFAVASPDREDSRQGNQDIADENEALFSQKTLQERTGGAIPSKKIGRITVFYTDGSFDEFFPR